MVVLISVESQETYLGEGGRQPLVTSCRNLTTLLNGISFLYCDSLTVTGAHSLVSDGMPSLLRSPVLQHPRDGPGLETLTNLSGNWWHLVYFPVSLIDILSHPRLFLLPSNFPLIHPCHLELVNVGSSATYPTFLLAMLAAWYFFQSCVIWTVMLSSLASLRAVWEEGQLMCGSRCC